MTTQLKEWGNSHAIRIPIDIVKDAKLKTDDVLEISIEGDKIILSRPFSHKTLKERMSVYGGKLGIFTEEYDFGDTVGREVW